MLNVIMFFALGFVNVILIFALFCLAMAERGNVDGKQD